MRYLPKHEQQYDYSARTSASGCTWTSVAMGVDAQSGGKLDPSPDTVLSKVARSEETNPQTPGWSLTDADLAMQRMGVPFVPRVGQGWAAVRSARTAGLYIVLQGDSDRFPDGCSGQFDGDHCIGIHPDDAPDGRWRIDDPICPGSTFQPEARLRAYAEKFMPGVAFGVFTRPVPVKPPDTSTGDDDMDLYSVPGRWQAQFRIGANVYPKPGVPSTGTLDPAKWYDLTAQDAPTAAFYLLDGGVGQMAWGRVADISRRRELADAIGQPQPATYVVTVGGKSAGSVTLP